MLPADSSVEQRLVLALLHRLTQETVDPLPALAKKVDWKTVFGLVAPPLHPYLGFAIEQSGLKAWLPPWVRQRLDAAERDAILRCTRRRKELAHAGLLLRERGIEAMVFKGFALAETVYPKPYLRMMQDVDLLLHAEDLDSAEALLIQDGYLPKTPRAERMASPVESLRSREITLAKIWRHDLVMLELHATLHFDRTFDAAVVQQLWQDSRPFTLDGVELRVPHLHDQLSDLCVHLVFYHQVERSLLWLLDLRLFLERVGMELQWPQFAASCRERGTDRYVNLALRLAHEWLGAVLPEDFDRLFALPGEWEDLREVCWQQTWYSNLPVQPPRHLWEALFTGSPRKLWLYLRGRQRRWAQSGPDDRGFPRTRSAWAVRARSDLHKLGKAVRLGALRPANLRHSYEIEQRRRRLANLLGMQRVDPEGIHR